MKPWFDTFVGTRAGAGKDAGGGGEAKLDTDDGEKVRRAWVEFVAFTTTACVEMPGTNLVLFIPLFNGLLNEWVLPSSDDDVPLT